MKKNQKTYLQDLAEKEAMFASLQYCDESGEFKVVYETYDEAREAKRDYTVPLRIYPCKGHYHFTSKLKGL